MWPIAASGRMGFLALDVVVFACLVEGTSELVTMVFSVAIR